MGKRKASAVLDAPPKFYVHLAATTPIAHNGVEIEADSAEQAWEKFCAMNGISGSSCQRTINEVER